MIYNASCPTQGFNNHLIYRVNATKTIHKVHFHQNNTKNAEMIHNNGHLYEVSKLEGKSHSNDLVLEHQILS